MIRREGTASAVPHRLNPIQAPQGRVNQPPSREAAKERSPRRKPWENAGNTQAPTGRKISSQQIATSYAISVHLRRTLAPQRS